MGPVWAPASSDNCVSSTPGPPCGSRCRPGEVSGSHEATSTIQYGRFSVLQGVTAGRAGEGTLLVYKRELKFLLGTGQNLVDRLGGKFRRAI